MAGHRLVGPAMLREGLMTRERDDVQLLTVPEAARLLRIGRNLAYELVARGELPAVRLGRVIRVPRASLEQWIHAASKSSAPGIDVADRHRSA